MRLTPSLALSTLLASGLFAAIPSPSLFITDQEAADIYRDGWIDLNKNGRKDIYEDPTQDLEDRVTDLLKQMTVKEKTAQMVTLYGFPRVLRDELPTSKWDSAFWKDGIGNIDEHITGVEVRSYSQPPKYVWPLANHVRAKNEVQRFFVERTRLGIPADFSNEATRGVAHVKTTSLPCQLAVGSTWNKDLVLEIGRLVGREARALGNTNLYSPTLDLACDPRWGRTPDCYSEDPFLAAELGMAQVRGIQEQRVVSTLKHFALYSISKGGRDGPHSRGDSQATWREVQTVHLHPFRKAIRDAGALGVMASYNDYDGIPIHGNSLFLTEILRTEYKFRGYVVSDTRGVDEISGKYRVAENYAEAVRQSVTAGLNICTEFRPPENFGVQLRRLIVDGKLSIDLIDSRVRDILRVKFWQGVFDSPYQADPEAAERIIRAEAHLAIASQVARESLVLLKNDRQTLPLKKNLRKIVVTGPLANDREALFNRYAPKRLEFVTVLDGIRRKVGASCDVTYLPGCDVVDENFPESDVSKMPPGPKAEARIGAVVEASRGADVIVAVCGENDEVCAENRSRVSLDLPGYQNALLRALHGTGVPVILVLINGRPLSVNEAAVKLPAILEAWFPGEEGGNAIADALFGDYNPGGRIPITFPRSAGSIPYNFPIYPGAGGGGKGPMDGPLYAFGHGLSYTSFEYDNLQVSHEKQSPDRSIEVSLRVKNTGRVAGDEVVQLYIRDDYSTVNSFDRMLRGFKRIHLKAGESHAIRFTLLPEHLAIYDRNQNWTVEPGRFSVMLGSSSEDIRLRGSFVVVGSSERTELPSIETAIDLPE